MKNKILILATLFVLVFSAAVFADDGELNHGTYTGCNNIEGEIGHGNYKDCDGEGESRIASQNEGNDFWSGLLKIFIA